MEELSTSSRMEDESISKKRKDIVIVVTANRDFYERLFEKKRRTVDYLGDGSDALWYLGTLSEANEIPVILITEETLRDMTGLKLVGRVKAELQMSGLPFVIVSPAYAVSVDLEKANSSLKGKGKAQKDDKEHVLLIDDNRNSQKIIRKFLKNTPLEVKISRSHTPANVQLDDPTMGSVKVIIADYKLFGNDACELVNAIKLRNIPLVVIVLPGQSDVNSQRLMEIGALMIMSKPLVDEHGLMLKPLWA